MSLLQDIQNAAVDPHTDICALLRMCKILAVRLGNDEFKKWADSELNGYKDMKDLPEYRIIDIQSYGHFDGLAGSGLRNAPIPPSCLPESIREWSTKSWLMQPISAYAVLLPQEGNNPQEQWPADTVAEAGQHIYRYMNCISAWKLIPRNALAALVDTLRTRVLNFVLEIEVQAPDAGEALPNRPPLPQDRVSQVFNNYIYGSLQNLAAGSNHVSQSGTFIVTNGDLDSLEQYLTSIEVEKEDIVKLRECIRGDAEMTGRPTFGERVQSWVGVMVGKAASGAWSVSTSVAGALLGKALSQYYGLN